MLMQLLGTVRPENMDLDIWVDGNGYLEAIKDRKHGVVLSVFPDPTKGIPNSNAIKISAPSRSHE
jgi:hypothetical protein